MPAFSTVVVTPTAKSKGWRLYPTFEVKDIVKQLHGELYRKGDTNEYHLITPDDLVIAFAVKSPSKATVITQMHIHDDYEREEVYRPVESPFVHVGVAD